MLLQEFPILLRLRSRGHQQIPFQDELRQFVARILQHGIMPRPRLELALKRFIAHIANLVDAGLIARMRRLGEDNLGAGMIRTLPV